MKPTLGEHLRARRTERGIGLREMARRVGISSTFLCKVEMDRSDSPPSEAKLRAIAQELGVDSDALLIMAGRLPSDVLTILREHPELLERIREGVA